jgi:GNAT superfamily N-acetyltransferase
MLNPPGVEVAYLEALQRNFGGWGGEPEFMWWFRRQVGGPHADLLVLVEGGDTLVAGTAVSYRQVDVGGGRVEQVGFITGAWTAPQYRRQGCYVELIQHARDVGGQRGASMLMAFAANDPSSHNALERASFAETQTWHLAGEGQGRPADPRAARPSDAQLHDWFHRNRAGAGIIYSELDVFIEQALLRDPTTRVAEAPGGLWGILAAEHTGGGVQAVISEDLLPDPRAVATALKVWGLPSYTTDSAVAKKITHAPASLFGLGVTGREPPPWPSRWSLHRMDRA